MKTKPITKPIIIVAVIACLAVAFFATSALTTDPEAGSPAVTGQSKAVLRVEGMTCAGCISTIKNSLTGFEGIDDVQVDLAARTAEILYDSTKHQGAEKMAAAVTASGYTATVMRVLSSKELQEQEQANRTKSMTAIASVGSIDIPRADFATELAHVESRYQKAYGADALKSDQGRQLLDNLKRQITQRLIDEAIQLQEVHRTGFTIDSSTVARQYEAYWQERGFADGTAFENELRQNGYPPAYFFLRFENRVLINTYVDKKVITANLNDIEKQQRYADWLTNARLLAAVTYHDKDLERLARQQASAGGCGQSCSTQ